MAEPPELLLASRKCDQCLCSSRRIVSGLAAAKIIAKCRTEDNHFICHKGQIAGVVVHCRGVHDLLGGSRAYRFAKAIDIPIVDVDPDHLKERANDRPTDREPGP